MWPNMARQYFDTSAFTPKRDIPKLFAPTVSMVAKQPLRLEGQPYDYHEYSPTPLDAMMLSNIGGPRYDEAALQYMEEMRMVHDVPPFASLDEATAWYDQRSDKIPDPVWLSMMREIMIQHSLKIRRNDRAMRELRKIHTQITEQEAEEIMQVRAGIASIPTMLRFMAKYPAVGGVELMKATRPGDPHAIREARDAFLEELEALDEPDIDIVVERGESKRLVIKPDEELQDTPDPKVVVLKTPLARAAVTLVGLPPTKLDIIGRDSGVILDPLYDNLEMTFMLGRRDSDGNIGTYIGPVGTTAYTRLAPGQETA